MRLIDADKLIDYFYHGINDRPIIDGYNDRKIIDIIKEQPTAYDVDKVVERLEMNSMYAQADDEPFVMLDDAVEIVKSGGIQYQDSVRTDKENAAENWKEHLKDRFNRFE